MSPRSKPPLKDKIVLLVGGQLNQSEGAASESHNFEIQSADEADVRIEEAIIALARAVFGRGGRLAFRHDPVVTPLVIEVALEYWQSLPGDRPVLIFAPELEFEELDAYASPISCAELREDYKFGELVAHKIVYVGGSQGLINEVAAQNLARPGNVFAIASTGGVAQSVVDQNTALDPETKIIETIYSLQREMLYRPPSEEEMIDPSSRDETLRLQEGQIPNFRYSLYPLVMESILESEHAADG